jgi:hypothetical protein
VLIVDPVKFEIELRVRGEKESEDKIYRFTLDVHGEKLVMSIQSP